MLRSVVVGSARVLRSFTEAPDSGDFRLVAQTLADALERLLYSVVERGPALADVVDQELFGREGGVDCLNCGRKNASFADQGCGACGFLEDNVE